MKNWIAPSVLLVAMSVAIAQESTPVSFRDDLLDRLAGTWNVTGAVHGNPSTQKLQADWVLHHQFLRLYQKSSENVAQRDFPFEGAFFIGYDNTEKRYVAHLMTVFGGRDSETLGYGRRTGDQIIFEFKQADGSVTQKFMYTPKSKTWHIVSSATTSEGTQLPILDLTATPSK